MKTISNRDIKFRAWDKEQNKMVYVSELDWYGPIFEGGKTQLWIHNSAAMNTHQFLAGMVGDRYELMQYTCLKDKHGKEIWEGDIVYSKSEGAYPVAADTTGCWVIEIYNEYFNDDGTSTPRDESELLSNALIDYGMEVIGNIYENPELLANN